MGDVGVVPPAVVEDADDNIAKVPPDDDTTPSKGKPAPFLARADLVVNYANPAQRHSIVVKSPATPDDGALRVQPCPSVDIPNDDEYALCHRHRGPKRVCLGRSQASCTSCASTIATAWSSVSLCGSCSRRANRCACCGASPDVLHDDLDEIAAGIARAFAGAYRPVARLDTSLARRSGRGPHT
ncbi:Uncharacterized protein PBTT_08741 [Plasmodiophora brassicae]